MRKGWLKNTTLATVMATTLTACGGGGGGGAIGVVKDFVQEDLTNLVQKNYPQEPFWRKIS